MNRSSGRDILPRALPKEMEKVEEAVRHLEDIRARDGEAVTAYLMKLST